MTQAVIHKYLVQTYSRHGKISSHCYLNKYIHTYIKIFLCSDYKHAAHYTMCVSDSRSFNKYIYFSFTFTICYNSFGTFNTSFLKFSAEVLIEMFDPAFTHVSVSSHIICGPTLDSASSPALC